MNPTAAKLIKIASILSMTCALGLLGWNLSLHLQGKSLPPNLTFFFWLGIVALFAHGVEGLIAAAKARSYDKNPLRYGIYTFFVGFIGLQELANRGN
ncbi:MAG: hypothetical protein HC939_20070 [Pleurocapsa sp. SU_5_0]|nr:hypothetical protein [Pleurocapsa sp. SU_5_0]NJO99132.1 hypothetical protein [Pleurocapsa sp. CRU_1_2]NJR46468.1 hypothetical protein [Hyellaceae cyanobacterium CSU_1_1]